MKRSAGSCHYYLEGFLSGTERSTGDQGAAISSGIGGLAPDKATCNNCDGVPGALIFLHEHGAGFEAPRAICWWPSTSRETCEMLGGFRVKAPKRLLLDVTAKKPCDEILGEARRRRRTSQTAE